MKDGTIVKGDWVWQKDKYFTNPTAKPARILRAPDDFGHHYITRSVVKEFGDDITPDARRLLEFGDGSYSGWVEDLDPKYRHNRRRPGFSSDNPSHKAYDDEIRNLLGEKIGSLRAEGRKMDVTEANRFLDRIKRIPKNRSNKVIANFLGGIDEELTLLRSGNIEILAKRRAAYRMKMRTKVRVVKAGVLTFLTLAAAAGQRMEANAGEGRVHAFVGAGVDAAKSMVTDPITLVQEAPKVFDEAQRATVETTRVDTMVTERALDRIMENPNAPLVIPRNQGYAQQIQDTMDIPLDLARDAKEAIKDAWRGLKKFRAGAD